MFQFLRYLTNKNYILAIICFFSIQLNATPLLEKQPHFIHFSTAQGLPSSETYFIHQDRKGYVWICTDRGLVRYDGYRFKVFTEKDGLTDNVIFRIYEDPTGTIWFDTYNGLLCYWNGTKIIPYKYNHLIQKHLKNSVVVYKSFAFDRKGNLVYAAQQIPVLYISAKGKVSYSIRMDKLQKKYTQIIKAFDQWIIVTTRSSGLNTPTIKIVNGKNFFLGNSNVGTRAHLIRSNSTTFAHLNFDVIDIQNPTLKESHPSLINVSCADSYLFLGTANGVIRKPIIQFGKQQQQIDHLLNNYSITCTLKDSEGGHWFSTLEDGVFYCPNIDTRIYKDNTTNHNTIKGIAGNGFDIVFAKQLSYQQLTGEWIDQTKSFTSRKVVFLGNTLFVCDDVQNPVALEGKNGFKVTSFKDHFILSPTSMLLINTSILSLDKSGKQTEIYNSILGDRGKYSQRYLDAIAVDQKGRIFVGNQHGLFELKGKQLAIDHLSDSLFRTRVSDLDYHPFWGIIVATRGEGIYTFDEYQMKVQLIEKNGLVDNQINSLFVEKNGIIWVATNKGVNKIKRLPSGKINVERFTTYNGLPTNEVNAIYAFGGKVWFATKKGLVVTSDQLNGNHIIQSQLKVDRIETDKETFLNFNKMITIGSNREFIKLFLRSTNFRTGANRLVRYRYNSSDKWLTISTGELALTKPNGGDYALEISYQNEHGIWSNPETIVHFHVKSPFYARWYFISGSVVIGLLLIILIFRMRLKQLDRRYQLQKTINDLEQRALRAQMNPHFIFNSLNSIQSFLVYEENEKAEKYLLKFAQLIRQTLNNSRETYISLETEIETLRRYLELEQMRFKEKFSFKIVIDLTQEQLNFGVPPMLIQPFVENAVLHGFKPIKSEGEITLSFLSIQNNQLLCTVDDNGCGRKITQKLPSDEHKSFGTKITDERLAIFQKKHDDKFTIEIIDKEENKVATGTKVVLRIPVVTPQQLNLFEN